jgi:hypothetical protein
MIRERRFHRGLGVANLLTARTFIQVRWYAVRVHDDLDKRHAVD